MLWSNSSFWEGASIREEGCGKKNVSTQSESLLTVLGHWVSPSYTFWLKYTCIFQENTKRKTVSICSWILHVSMTISTCKYGPKNKTSIFWRLKPWPGGWPVEWWCWCGSPHLDNGVSLRLLFQTQLSVYPNYHPTPPHFTHTHIFSLY